MVILPLNAVVELNFNGCVCGACEPLPPVWQRGTVVMLQDGEYLLEKADGTTWYLAEGEDSGHRFLTVPQRTLGSAMAGGAARYVTS